MPVRENIHDQIILGSGPAGYTAAIYTARSNCCPLLISGLEPGGQLTGTTLVENFPGFPDGVDGPELMESMRRQAEKFGTVFVSGEVSRVELSEHPYKIWVGDDLYRCRSLIVCTGASPRMLGLPNEKELYGRGVSVCATCDGFFYRGKEVVVVGGGDTAMEDALFLARFAAKVTVVHRRNALRASAALQQRAQANAKIHFVWDTVVTAILGDKQQGVRGVRLQHLPTAKEEDCPCDGIFVAIGHVPNTTLFKGQLDLDDWGYILTRNGTETNLPGVFAAGDVQDPFFRQAISAAGTGCMAAMQSQRFLECLEDADCKKCQALQKRHPVAAQED
ncbi:thioredoxin reductase [Syntrophotalea carbinolica DSM 2380]|uniref:Thioredoxin reductase n=1 Tax=Syntrophotalea carbinolica (strain DSM 2380 / NBRC 103641 / GraBd1) TaxID=338963 RepID=Q3A0C9_SYNC1|nr:thioredoxin-disulfide reductase [Syntrophotalea carbinolica]ABA90178.1 thioredoxin reductase [Syntrophotalea carbinolica DSM 2380]